MKKEIIVGVIAAVCAALITWIVTMSMHNLDKVELQIIADKIVQQDSFRKLLLSEFKKDDAFKGENGEDGINGQNGLDGKPGVSEPKNNGTNWCSDFSEGYQICWGHQETTDDKVAGFYKNRKDFDFTYVNPFSEPPMVVNSLEYQSSLHTIVASASVTNSEFKGSVRLIGDYNVKHMGPSIVSYIAIGKK